MGSEITEALTEMHFYRPLFDLFEAHYGRQVLRVLKPSQNREAFLGFDLAWVQTTEAGATVAGVQQDLQDFIHKATPNAPSVFLGYFLQFKVVDEITRKSKAVPPGFQTPYLRSELSMHPNKESGISQHETLLRLHRLPLTDVSYACAMLLYEEELHRPASLDDLRIVPIATAPTGYASNERHFIAFQARDSQPVWCSDPVEGKSVTPREWVEGLTPMRADELAAWMRRIQAEVSGPERYFTRGGKPRLPYALTLVALGERRA